MGNRRKQQPTDPVMTQQLLTENTADEAANSIVARLAHRPDAREILMAALNACTGPDEDHTSAPGEPVDDEEPVHAPEGIAPTECRYCGQKVIWIITPKGKKLCVDTRSPVFIVARTGIRPQDLTGVNINSPSMRERLAPLIKAPLAGVYVSHFRTCRKVDKVKADQAKKKEGER